VGLVMSVSAISITGQIDPAVVNPTQLLPAFLPVILPLAVLIVPLLDFSLAVIRRLRRGMSPFDADRAHLHHRLLDMGPHPSPGRSHSLLLDSGVSDWHAHVPLCCLVLGARHHCAGPHRLDLGDAFP